MHARGIRVGTGALHPTRRCTRRRTACINLHKLIAMQTKRFDVELGYHGEPPRLTPWLNRASYVRSTPRVHTRRTPSQDKRINSR